MHMPIAVGLHLALLCNSKSRPNYVCNLFFYYTCIRSVKKKIGQGSTINDELHGTVIYKEKSFDSNFQKRHFVMGPRHLHFHWLFKSHSFMSNILYMKMKLNNSKVKFGFFLFWIFFCVWMKCFLTLFCQSINQSQLKHW